VSLKPGAVLPKNMNEREFSAWCAKQITAPKTTDNYANDAAAAAAGIQIGGTYHTSGTVKVRLV
jgi:hypothetical protein